MKHNTLPYSNQPSDLKTETQKAYKSRYLWLLQAENILSALIWTVASIALLTVTMAGTLTIIVVLTLTPEDTSTLTLTEIQAQLFHGVVVIFFISTFFMLTFGLHKRLRNVFRKAAMEQKSRYEDVTSKIYSQMDTTEMLLTHYQLITPEQVQERRKISAQKVKQ